MENKYYTPTIEEFCIGFEFERSDGNGYFKQVANGYQFSEFSTLINKSAFNKIYDNSASLHEHNVKCLHTPTYKYYKNSIELERVRVKYLDKEDIESLGFSFYKEEAKTLINEPVMLFHSEKLNIILGHYYTLNKIAIITKDPSKNSIYSKTGQDPYKIAGIKIKNKTELIKLLKQLEVL